MDMTIGRDRYRQVDRTDRCTENTRTVTQGSSVSFVLFIPRSPYFLSTKKQRWELLKGMCQKPLSEDRSKNRYTGMSGRFYTGVFRISLVYRLPWRSWIRVLWYDYESNQQDATIQVNLLFLVGSTCFGRCFRPSSGALPQWPGIDPGTLRLVAQCLNHCATPGPIRKR